MWVIHLLICITETRLLYRRVINWRGKSVLVSYLGTFMSHKMSQHTLGLILLVSGAGPVGWTPFSQQIFSQKGIVYASVEQMQTNFVLVCIGQVGLNSDISSLLKVYLPSCSIKFGTGECKPVQKGPVLVQDFLQFVTHLYIKDVSEYQKCIWSIIS